MTNNEYLRYHMYSPWMHMDMQFEVFKIKNITGYLHIWVKSGTNMAVKRAIWATGHSFSNRLAIMKIIMHGKNEDTTTGIQELW